MKNPKPRNTIPALTFFVTISIIAIFFDVRFSLSSDRHGGYNLLHFFYGLGFPFFFGAIISICSKVPLFGSEYMWAIGVCIILSMFNEVVIYAFNNPAHGADWDHLASDITGLFIASILINSYLRGNFFPRLKHDDSEHKTL